MKSNYLSLLENCNICPRKCGVNRLSGAKGFCGATGDNVKVSKIMLHKWEEPCISGNRGSGAVFFSGCNLKCIYCQNYKISRDAEGEEYSVNQLAKAFLDLQDKGAHNINLVTPTHFMPQIAETVLTAKEKGLNIPIVYNTSGYETAEAIKMLSGIVDVYLTDFKYADSILANEYSKAKDYFNTAASALKEMFLQTGEARFDNDGNLQKGIIVRHLVLPSHVDNSRDCIEYLYKKYGNKIFMSIMNQYTPLISDPRYPNLSRKITEEEYDEVVNFAIDIGVENAFVQEGGTVSESFIPDF